LLKHGKKSFASQPILFVSIHAPPKHASFSGLS
jgi:hypothetical protein